MSITGGLFNTGHKKDDAGDTKTTADGDTTATESPAADLTTSIPGFDDTDDGFIVETGGEFEDTDGESWGANLDVESVTSEGTNVDVESVTSQPQPSGSSSRAGASTSSATFGARRASRSCAAR